MKILIVEDDPAVATTVSDLLSVAYHYATDVVEDGQTGLEMAETFSYDLVLLDVLLPGLDGVTVCQRLREKGRTMPILLLTGEEGSQKIARAINLGADDYVVKPFDVAELMARVQALLRRGGPNTLPFLVWGDLLLDPNHRSFTYLGQSIELSPKEYAILEFLLRKKGQVLSPKVIIDQVWSSDDYPGEEVVRVHIKRLRAKLQSAGAPSDFIKTVYRVGYCLNPLYEESHPPQANDATQATKSTQATESTQATPSIHSLPVAESVLNPVTSDRDTSDQDKTLSSPQAIEMPPSQSSDSMNAFVHDLNNVFGAILASVQLLQLSHSEQEAFTQEHLDLIEQSAMHGASRVKKFFFEQEKRNGD